MGWDCNGGDVSAGVLCRALRRAARARRRLKRVGLYRISALLPGIRRPGIGSLQAGRSR